MSTTAMAIATAAATPPCRPFAHATRGRRATHGCTRCRAFARSRREAGAAVARGVGAGCPLAGRRLPSRRPNRRLRRGGWPPPWALTPPPRRRRLSAGQRHGDSCGGPRASALTQGHEEAAAAATARAGRRGAGQSATPPPARPLAPRCAGRQICCLQLPRQQAQVMNEGGGAAGQSPSPTPVRGTVRETSASDTQREVGRWWEERPLLTPSSSGGRGPYPQPPLKERRRVHARHAVARPRQLAMGTDTRPGVGGWRHGARARHGAGARPTPHPAHSSRTGRLWRHGTRGLSRGIRVCFLERWYVLLPAPLLRTRLVIEISG